VAGFAGPLSFFLDEEGTLRQRLPRPMLEEVLRSGRGPLWVDIDSTRDEEFTLLSELFGFHPLAVEDTRSPDCRIKIEEYEGYLFIVVRGIRFAVETPEPYDIDTRNLYLFLGPQYLVSVHAGPSRSTETVAERLEVAPELLGRGLDHLTHLILDTLVDFYFPLLDQIDDFVDELEDRIFAGDDGELMQSIFDLKRTLLSLRRHLAPMREVAGTLANRPSPYLRPEVQVYFRDVYDHVVRQLESVETFRELVTGALELNLSVVSNRTNEVIKVLSIIATVVLPPTLVASVYGMNFEWMPGLHHPRGFWLAMAMMGVISAAFLVYLWRKHWL